MQTFNIGDRVWYASRKSTEERVTCPECFGKKFLTVILGDGNKVTIDCAGCAAGIAPSRGYVTYHKQNIDVTKVIICKVELNPTYVEYGFGEFGYGHHVAKDTDIFQSRMKAEIRAKELAEEWNKEQLEKIHRKEKNNRTWSWHVHYYRKQIRDAEKTIEYATKQLDAAKAHTKKED